MKEKVAADHPLETPCAQISHNLPQEAPKAFAEAVIEVDGYST